MNYIRVFNKEHGAYFISAVYGRCDVGASPVPLIIYDPFDEAFIRWDESRRNTEGYWDYRYEEVLFDPTDYEHIEGARLLPFKRYAREQGLDAERMSFFQGRPTVLGDKEFLLRVLRDGRVPLAETDMEVCPLVGTDGWTYLHTAEEALAFMKQMFGLHDAYMEEIRYDGASLSMVIDAREWAEMCVELCFEGRVSANLRPWVTGAPAGALWDASTLRVGNCAVFFALDTDMPGDIPDVPDDDIFWIRSIAVKWRKVEPPPEDEGEAE